MSSNNAVLPVAWYRSLNATQWKTLIAANLGWTFDGFEFFALFLTVGFALHQLLDAAQYTAIPRYAGYVVAATAFGWAIGGVIGGIIADYIGRKRTMILADLRLFANNWVECARVELGVFRDPSFFRRRRNRLGMGDRRVDRFGAVARSFTWQGRRPIAMLCRPRWHYRLRRVAGDRQYRPERLAVDTLAGGAAGADDAVDPPRHPRVATLGAIERAPRRGPRPAPPRRRIGRRTRSADALHPDRSVCRPRGSSAVDLLVLDDAVGNVRLLGRWHLCPDLCRLDRRQGGSPYNRMVGPGFGLVFTVCGVVGSVSFLGFLADAFGRKAIAMLFYLMCLILTPVVYLWTQEIHVLLFCVGVFGFFVLGIWSWAPIWLPELFPTRIRGTAIAFIFNAPRFIAAAGPLIAGTLIVALGSYGPAATLIGLFYLLGFLVAPFLPETRGKPLPELAEVQRVYTATRRSAA